MNGYCQSNSLGLRGREKQKSNLHLYEQRWKEVFPNMHMNINMIISTGPTSFLSISVYENDREAEANMEARTKLHEDFTNIKDDLFYKGNIQMFFQSDKFQSLKLKKLD